jgi:hypothetical protein
MMIGVFRVLTAIAIGALTWIAALFVSLLIPASPHAHAVAVMTQLADPSAGPEAFAEFMALGRGPEWIDATVFTFLAATAVSLTSWYWLRMSRIELMVLALT